MKPSRRDLMINVMGTTGLLMISIGTGLYSFPLGLIVTGSILLSFATVGAIMK